MNKATLKTTEFILTLLTVIGVIASSVAGVLPDRYAAIVAGVSTAAYAISRGLAKVFGIAATAAPPAQPRDATK